MEVKLSLFNGNVTVKYIDTIYYSIYTAMFNLNLVCKSILGLSTLFVGFHVCNVIDHELRNKRKSIINKKEKS